MLSVYIPDLGHVREKLRRDQTLIMEKCTNLACRQEGRVHLAQKGEGAFGML
jgi:hypothetical protein